MRYNVRPVGSAGAARSPLTLTDLNRTLLARQLLLVRSTAPVGRALEAVAGLQAQDPVAPLFGLLSRLEGFDAGDLTRALHRRTVVRGSLMRGTVHLVSARDYLRLEPAVRPMIADLHRQYLRGREPMADEAVAGITPAALSLAAPPGAPPGLRRRVRAGGPGGLR